MRKSLWLAAFAATTLLAGCGSDEPKALNANPESVAIQYDDDSQLKSEVMEKAAARCSQWGKVPELTGVSQAGGNKVATFRCVGSSS